MPGSRRYAFTLVELLAGVAIVAILAAAGVFFTVSYINWAGESADKQTLVVLNDALTRYKTQGGNVNSLTAGARISNVLGRLGQTLDWAGKQHHVLQKGVTYPGRSIEAKGTGPSYRFTRFNRYTEETGGVSPMPGIQLSSALNFGEVKIGETAALPMTITNSGTANLTVSSLNLPTGFSADWNGGVIAPGAAQNVNVTFEPAAHQTYSGNVTVNHYATSPAATLALTGTGRYLANGSFELGNLNGWTISVSGTPTVAISTSLVQDGSYAATITFPTGMPQTLYLSQYVWVPSGRSLAFMYRTTQPGSSIVAVATFNGNVISSSSSLSTGMSSWYGKTWTQSAFSSYSGQYGEIKITLQKMTSSSMTIVVDRFSF